MGKWAKTPGPPIWDTAASCKRRPDLPWVANDTPNDFAAMEMRRICESCPVLRRCAEYALTYGGIDNRPGRGVEGGFYAGQWIPWRSEHGDISKKNKPIRLAARRALRLIAGIEPTKDDRD